MPRKVPLEPALQCEPFAVAAARARGYGKHRLLGADLQRPFRGIRCLFLDGANAIALCEAYLPRLQPGQFFSHGTASLIHGMPLPPSLPRALALHVTAIGPASVPRAAGVIGHSVDESRVHLVQQLGLPVGSPLQTWCELASILGRDDLVAVADFMLSGQHPLSSPSELVAAATNWGTRRGSRSLRQAAALARSGVDSRMESLTRMLVLDAGFPEPITNGTVTDAAGNWVAQSDLVYPQFKVVLEYDGDGHRADRKRFLDDIDRRQRIEKAESRVIQITSRHIFLRRDEAVMLIDDHLRAAGWRGKVTLPSPRMR